MPEEIPDRHLTLGGLPRGWLPSRHWVQSCCRRRIPFLASQRSNRRHHRRDLEFMFHAAHAPTKLVYTRVSYHGRDLALAGLLLSQRVVHLSAGQELKR
jgi:hypothetical protein